MRRVGDPFIGSKITLQLWAIVDNITQAYDERIGAAEQLLRSTASAMHCEFVMQGLQRAGLASDHAIKALIDQRRKIHSATAAKSLRNGQHTRSNQSPVPALRIVSVAPRLTGDAATGMHPPLSASAKPRQYRGASTLERNKLKERVSSAELWRRTNT